MSGKKRSFALDFVRAVAIVMVVAVHALPGTDSTRIARWYDSLMRTTLFTCNVLFFMLSGKLNVRVIDDEQLGRYYWRKCTRVLLPALVYILIQTIYECVRWGAGLWPWTVLRNFTFNALGDYSGGVHWFVMSLFGMLLASPLIAPAFVNMTPGRKRAFVWLLMLFAVPPLLLCRTDHAFGWSYYLGGFFGIYLLGSFIDLDRLAALPTWKVALPTLCCIVISAGLLRLGFPHHPINDSTPFYYAAGIGLLVLLYGWGQHLKPHPAIELLARHSFGIYLCHIPLLTLMRPLFESLPFPLAHLFLAIASTIVSLAFAAAVDTFLVAPAQQLADKAVARDEVS